MKREKTGKTGKAAKASGKAAKQTFWGGRMSEAPEEKNVAFCAGRDVATRPMADAVLIPFDVWQNRVHSTVLARQGVTPKASLRKILAGLDEFEKRAAAGELTLDPRKEDVHTNIEHFVAQHAGPEHSGYMHTGRSRNDQTTTVVRMYVRAQLLEFGGALSRLVDALLSAAAANADVPMAGFTHYQPASLTTVGHWLAAHAQALQRDLDRLLDSYDRVNVCPLGAAASFGTSWPVDRPLAARLLGFRAVQPNTLDCITNRWEMEADAASVLSFAMTHLSMLAQDVIMLSSPFLGIIDLPDRFVTGSSIMPQKRNPDFAEVTRAKATLVQNLTNTLFGIARGAFTGYNRDTQWTKYVVMDLFDEASAAPDIFAGVVDGMRVNPDRAAAFSRENFVDAVDVADALARGAGLPFRTTYDIVSRAVRLSEGQGRIDLAVVARLAAEAGVEGLKLEIGTPDRIVAAKAHVGGPAPKALRRDLKPMQAALKASVARLGRHAKDIEAARAKTAQLARELAG